MARFCYCSQVLPGKEEEIRAHWRDKVIDPPAEEALWDATGMTDFHSWLQPQREGYCFLHYLEAESFGKIFRGLREQIAAGNSCALKLQSYYRDVLGKDYADSQTEPEVELLLDLSRPASSSDVLRRARCWPLLAHKEEEHRQFRKENMGSKRSIHEALMDAFGLTQLSSWIQTTPAGKWIILYVEGGEFPEPEAIPKTADYEHICSTLEDHTGLNREELFPKLEWLTHSGPVVV